MLEFVSYTTSKSAEIMASYTKLHLSQVEPVSTKGNHKAQHNYKSA